ncbi:hypothetical protein WBG78_24865 [Chryseolinea sp. T2]|uniref:hypothetical protein n=1 Tax=Chryseolinea sp. T2 TaxID=3129255 RepID=UPI0030776259
MKVAKLHPKHALLNSLSDYLLLDTGFSMGTDILELLAMATASDGWKALNEVDRENLEFRMIQTAMFLGKLDEHTTAIHTGRLSFNGAGEATPTESVTAAVAVLAQK